MQFPSVYRMLAIIRDNPKSRYTTLAELYGANPKSASIQGTLTKIKTLGWAECPPYKRSGYYLITPKGMKVLDLVETLEALE